MLRRSISGLALAAALAGAVLNQPTTRHGFAGYVIAIAIAHAVGMAAPICTARGWKAGIVVGALIAVLVVGAVSVGVDVANRSWPFAIVFVVLAGVSVALIAHLCGATDRVHDVEGPWLVRGLAYVRLAVGAIGGPVYAGWLILHSSDPGSVDAAWGLGVLIVVNSTVWVVTGRFPELIEAEQAVDELGGSARLDRFAPMLWKQIVAFTVSGLLTLMVLIVALAEPKHFDRPAYEEPAHAIAVAAVLALAVTLGMAGYAYTRRAAQWPGEALRKSFVELRSDNAGTVFLTASLVALIIGPALFNGAQGAFREEAAVFAAVLAAYIAESVYSNGVWLQLTSPDWNSGLMIILLPLAVFSPVIWLLQSGLWNHGMPTETDAAIPLVLAVFGAVAAVSAFVGSSLGWRAPRLSRTLHRPGQNVVQDSLVAAVLGILTGPLPFFVASRVKHGAAGVLGVMIATIAGILTALAWTARHDLEHIARERGREAAYVAGGDQLPLGDEPLAAEGLPAALETERVARVERRIYRWQLPVPLLQLLASITWLLVHLA